MTEFHIVAEGKTEMGFIKEVLTPHLAKFEVFVRCQMTHTGGSKIHPVKGGLGKRPKYQPIKRALERWIAADRGRTSVWYSTFIDLYAFPKDDKSPFTEAIQQISDATKRVESLEEAMRSDLNHLRFILYVQLHEFETFLFVHLDELKSLFPDRVGDIEKLKKETHGLLPEAINDNPLTAPSKRIIRHIPEYEGVKGTAGPLIATAIELDELRRQCPHFNKWLTRLEALGQQKPINL